MKRPVAIFILLMFGAAFVDLTPASSTSVEKIYIPSIGMVYRTAPRTPDLPEEPTLFKCKSFKDADQLVVYLAVSTGDKKYMTAPINDWEKLRKIITKYNYNKEVGYVLYIPSNDKGLDAEAPWRLKGSDEIVFETKENPKTTSRFYLRIFPMSLKDDHFEYFILRQGKKTKLIPETTDGSIKGN